MSSVRAGISVTDDDEVVGLLRTSRTARFWRGGLQLQVWRSRWSYAFNVSWHGKRLYFGFMVEVDRPAT